MTERADPGAPSRTILWEPAAHAWSTTRMGRFLTRVAAQHDVRFASYADAYDWSVRKPESLWAAVADEFAVRFATPPTAVLEAGVMPDVRWFPGATLNYAGHALDVLADIARRDPERVVLVARSQIRARRTLTACELHEAVARCAAGLAQLGVGPGDRVAAVLPNGAEAVIALLATASLGAVWSSCAPEFGVPAVIDRFGQIGPKVLLAVTATTYGARSIDRRDELSAIRAGLPTLLATVVVPATDDHAPSGDGPAGDGPVGDRLLAWAQLLDAAEREAVQASVAVVVPVAFDHPLSVLYSSGSTGPPKAIVHGHGGILLEHLKVLGLHHDLGEHDTLLWFSTTGWMMWNLLVSGLLVGARIVLFDGDPKWPAADALWRIAAEERCTVVGVGSAALQRHHATGLKLSDDIDLSCVRQVGATGSPLPPGGFQWVAEQLGAHVQTVSVSGGTDMCTAFVGANPLLPVRTGELQARCLGAAVEAWDAEGHASFDILGELVITVPMPSMPIGLWGDDDRSRLHATYYAQAPGVWWHGDWLLVRPDGGCVISGRSDATLNRGGIRSGTAEFTAVVEQVPGVSDSLIVHRELLELDIDELILLVVLDDGVVLDAKLRSALCSAVRGALSPRHVPDRVIAVPAVPRTISGKKVEVPVRQLLAGGDPSRVVAIDALADPSAWGTLVAVFDAEGLLDEDQPLAPDE